MDTNLTWISPNFKVRDGLLYVGAVAVEDIIKQVHAPCYVYDAQTIANQYQALKQALEPNGVEIFYSVKANPSLAVVNLLSSLGSGLEIASGGELLVAQKIKADPRRISFAGPVKTEEEIAAALDYGIFTFNIEGEREAQRINEIAGKKKIKAQVGLRINPRFEVEGAVVKMGGGSKKFGFDEEKIDRKLITRLQKLDNLKLAGIHVFAATQILDVTSFLANMKHIFEIAQKLNNLFPLQYLDLGGGLGIPYAPDQLILPLERISRNLASLFQEYPFLQQNKVRVYMEPGRFLVGQSGIYIVAVDDVIKSRGKTIVRVDGGIQHLLRPALFGNQPVFNLSKLNSSSNQVVDIGGCLCTSLDFLAKDVNLPLIEPGDLIGFFNAGAYGYTESMPFFLSHGIPPEVLIKNGELHIIRKGIPASAFLEGQSLPKGEEIKHVEN